MKNKVQLIGYVGQDPEFRSFENEVSRLKCSIATHDRVKMQKGPTRTELLGIML